MFNVRNLTFFKEKLKMYFNNMKLDSLLEKKSMKHHFLLAQSATDLTRKETYISEFYK
jgi:hypothetical protein